MTRSHNLNRINNRPPECPFIRNSLKASPAAQDDGRGTTKAKAEADFSASPRNDKKLQAIRIIITIFNHLWIIPEVNFEDKTGLSLQREEAISARMSSVAAAGFADWVMGRPTTSIEAPAAIAEAGVATRR